MSQTRPRVPPVGSGRAGGPVKHISEDVKSSLKDLPLILQRKGGGVLDVQI